MATKKFAGESPYKVAKKTHPESDWVFTNFVNNVNLVSDKPQKPPVVAAIFGIGLAGSIHLSNISRNKRVILKYIIDDRKDRFEKIKAFWSLSDDVVFLTSKDSDRVFKDKDVTAVFISSPTFTHHEIIVNSIANNKDVFCEKPIGKNVEEVKKSYDAAKASGRVLYAAFQRRFDPSYRSLKTKVREGKVGHIQVLKATARDSPIPPIEYLKASGGIFNDSMVHDFDLACWVLGELPVKAQATATALIPEIKAIDDFDNVAYLLTFPSGAIVIGDNNRYGAHGYDQRLEVFGNKGMIKVDNVKPSPSTEFVIGQDGCTTNPIHHSFPSRYETAYKNELEHFLDVVQHGVPADVQSWQILAIAKVASAVEESARNNRSVEIDWSKDDIPENYS